MSAERVTNVQLTISEEAALTIKALLYRLNWSDFPFAEQLTTDIENLELDGDVTIEYDFDTEEFKRG